MRGTGGGGKREGRWEGQEVVVRGRGDGRDRRWW